MGLLFRRALSKGCSPQKNSSPFFTQETMVLRRHRRRRLSPNWANNEARTDTETLVTPRPASSAQNRPCLRLKGLGSCMMRFRAYFTPQPCSWAHLVFRRKRLGVSPYRGLGYVANRFRGTDQRPLMCRCQTTICRWIRRGLHGSILNWKTLRAMKPTPK